jgi:hypothetical protein
MTMSIVSIFLFWPLAIPAIITPPLNLALQVGDYAALRPPRPTHRSSPYRRPRDVGPAWCCVGAVLAAAT